MKKFLSEVFLEKETAGKVGLRFDVYVDARHEPDVEERFARACLAADHVRNDPQKICGFYTAKDT